jgi:anthranilate synthase component I
MDKKGPSKRQVRVAAVELATDTLTPAVAFHRLGLERRDAFLCEGVTEGQTSVESAQVPSRYSIMGFDPFQRLTLSQGTFRIEAFEGGAPRVVEEKRSGDPFADFKAHLASFSIRREDYGPTLFDAGFAPMACAVGYIGYDSVAYMEKIALPDADVRPHGFHDACLALFRNLLVFDHVRSRVRIVRNDFSGESEADTRAELARIERELSRGGEPEPIAAAGSAPAIQPEFELGKERYIAALKVMKEHIRAGDIFQCVLSERMRVPLKAHPFRVYRALRMLNPSPYHYYFASGSQTVVGASPEMLLKVGQDGIVETCPIAGTRPRGADVADDQRMEKQLQASVKEKAEHVMLVDLARNDLGRVSEPGTVKVAEFMRVRRFSHVMHLVSTVKGKLSRRFSAWDALVATFPAGTLTGAPKVRAMQIIGKLEPVRRGPYGGAFVLYDFSGRLDSAIMIRTMFASPQGAFIQAGAGIVADSRPEMEYQEVLSKARPVLKAIEVAQAGGLS